MKIILDTSFIISCVRERIDFLDTEKFGILLVPVQVISEIEELYRTGKGKHREIASIALKILDSNRVMFKEIDLKEDYVDRGIINYVSGKKDMAVATLDRELKRKLKGEARIVTLKARKRIYID
jgi:rRNA-processing protein FCF1